MAERRPASSLAQSLGELKPKESRPPPRASSGSWITQAQERLGSAGPRLGWLVAATVVSAGLQRTVDEAGAPLFLLGGGRHRPLRCVGVSAYSWGMSQNVAAVERALLALDHHDRAAVIHRGLRSLDAADTTDVDQNEIDAAWRTELRRRLDDIESGKVELLDVDESHAQLRVELAAQRR